MIINRLVKIYQSFIVDIQKYFPNITSTWQHFFNRAFQLNFYGGLVYNIIINNNHYENKPIKIYWKFYHQKMKIFR